MKMINTTSLEQAWKTTYSRAPPFHPLDKVLTINIKDIDQLLNLETSTKTYSPKDIKEVVAI
jgi:hypothetical protein